MRFSFLCSFMAVLVFSVPANALLLIDFGDKVYNGIDGGPAGLTVSPGDWKQFDDDNGTTQNFSGITVQIGTAQGNSVDWPGNGGQNGGSSPENLMDVDDLYDDYVRAGSNDRAFGVRVNNLPIGTYNVYAIPGSQDDEDSAKLKSVALGQGNSSADEVSELINATSARVFDFNDELLAWTAAGAAGNAFNYLTTQVTISDSANDYVIFITEPDPTEKHGINALQIVEVTMQAVPEPAAMTLVVMGGLALLRRRRVA